MPPLLLVHGATLGANLFDLPRPGYSLMWWLASGGRAVYALDVRGFGNSPAEAVMDASADMHPPFVRLGEAVSDIGASVDLILARERAESLDLVGFSWGTITSAHYAATYPRRVARLALYAPLYSEVNLLWLDRIADPGDHSRLNPSIGAYRLMTKADLIGRWNSDLPTHDPSLYRESNLPDLVFEVFSALDPRANSSSVPAFRCPSGPLVDLVSVFNGRPLYDPSKLGMPTLLVRGSDDTTSTDTDARRLLAAIASLDKSYCVIAPGSHFLILERNRSELYERLDDFLGPVTN
ncbi:MAG: alpha/beta hydrolase [Rhodospirillales bacterium]|nr:alpha/beta hydrolase [Rhodospirillales bacterium]